jgi:hypothetical protein
MAEARVVIIRSQNVWTGSGVLDAAVVDRMLARGLALLRVDGGNAAPFRHDDRVGIKVNTIGGRALSTRPEVALGLAGVTAGMKNYFGAIHNPNKYHDAHCDPHVAEVFDAPPIKSKHRLTVLDALVVQFHKGPAYHPRWAGKYGGFVFSLDPVAADTVGWTIIERLRAEAGLPTLQEEGRAPGYIGTAGRMGLGVADPAAIETVEETVA